MTVTANAPPGADDFAQTVRHYQGLLERDPNNADLLYQFAVTAGQHGYFTRAAELVGRAVALRPDVAAYHAALAEAHHSLGEYEKAAGCCAAALRLQPGWPAAHVLLGNAWRALRRWQEAHAAYGAALRLAPQLAGAHANLGWCLYLQGQRPVAFRYLRHAVELAPQETEPWQLLAQAYFSEADYAAAIPCSEQLIALNPTDAGRHKDLGWLLQMEGRLDEAADCYRRALELQPDHVDTLLYQGLLHADRGDFAAAEACYRRALAVNPRAAAALAQLADLLRGKLPEADRQAVLGRLGDPSVHGWPRANLLFSLANVEDAQGRFDAAAAWLAEANTLALRLRREKGQHHDPAEHSRSVDRLIARYTPALFERLQGAGDPSRLPVFVFGLPRSGTSLVEQVLAGHPQVHAAGELRLAFGMLKSLQASSDAAGEAHAALDRVGAAEVQQLAQRYLHALRAIVGRDRPGFTAQRVVDKMPENYLLLGFPAVLFPHATFIHVRRDLRDVAVSCWATNFHVLRWTNDPEHIAARFGDYRRLMAHWQGVLPVPVHEVVYERLVDDFEAEARRLVAACGLDWDPACSTFAQTRRPVRTASGGQVRQPLYRKALARWKHYEGPLASLFARLPTD
jgi:tetratricopeptide (TPR) repeat protein